MVTMQKVIVDWTGFQGAPGYSVFYRDSSILDTAYIRTFYDSVKAIIPSTVTLTVRAAGDLIDAATGALTGAWTTAANATVTGTTAGTYAAPAGAVVRWNTLGIVAGRRIRGRTFLVPLGSVAFQSDGSLLAGSITTIQTAAAALIASSGTNLGVWHRPVGGAGGVWFQTVNADVPDRAAILRSRRD